MDCNAVRSYFLGMRRERSSRKRFNLARLFSTALLGVSLLAGFGPELSAAETLVKEITVKQGALEQRYLLSPDIVYLKEKGGPEKFVKVAPQASMEGLMAMAAKSKTKAEDEVLFVVVDPTDPKNEAKYKVLFKSVIVELAPDADDKALAAEVGAVSKGRLAFDPAFCVFQTQAMDGALTVSAALKGKAGVISAEPEIAGKTIRFLAPNDTLFAQQWHLRNTGQNGAVPGIDANVSTVWDNYRGTGVRLLIVDDSLEHGHPDLVANVNTNISWDYIDNDADPFPMPGDGHGVCVAGIAAARGNNGLGVAGVAYEATISGVRLIGSALPYPQSPWVWRIATPWWM